jgi:predicted nucleic acid-binding protein
MTVVSNTSPINYLTLIGQQPLLETLFGEIIIPTSVAEELGHADAPVEIQELLNRRPRWLRIARSEGAAPRELAHLDRGERDAIQLALELRADFVLIDELRGREAAEKFGLAVIGTIGILDRAVRKGLVDGKEMAVRLSATSFRAAPRLLALLAGNPLQPAGGGAEAVRVKRSRGSSGRART